jgi:hypothetical protein
MGWSDKDKKKEYDRKRYELRQLKKGVEPKPPKPYKNIDDEIRAERQRLNERKMLEDEIKNNKKIGGKIQFVNDKQPLHFDIASLGNKPIYKPKDQIERDRLAEKIKDLHTENYDKKTTPFFITERQQKLGFYKPVETLFNIKDAEEIEFEYDEKNYDPSNYDDYRYNQYINMGLDEVEENEKTIEAWIGDDEYKEDVINTIIEKLKKRLKGLTDFKYYDVKPIRRRIFSSILRDIKDEGLLISPNGKIINKFLDDYF